ncbi:MAG: type 1 glutamine amidotransferase domain-containing protein [Myxococcota bacterium]|nr:type 1 glutamine amidotransferase domain-containing protein [Myxococcota bacterium]
MTRTILIPLPDRDFDVTEVAVPWKLLTVAGYDVVFATAAGGAPPSADPLLLTGVLFGQLGARPEAIAWYRELEQQPAFLAPRSWRGLDVTAYAGLVLPGGHAPGMKPYLEDAALRDVILAFWQRGAPVAAICHGVLAAARTIDPATGRSILHGRRTTCLPKYMERTAWLLTAWKLGRYYRTYPTYVEDEVRAAVADPTHFERGPRTLTRRGTATADRGTFVVEDGAYVSARWPGDAYHFTRRFLATLATAATVHASTVARG